MSGSRVLIVDDNAMNMELATDILESAGYVVLQAIDAERAISLARSDKPALILMDIRLPGMDGLTAVGLLKNDPETNGIPVIALTAYAMKGDKERSLEAGCDGYLTKPITIKGLLGTVASFIDEVRQ